MNFNHLKECKLTYFQHAKRALYISISMLFAGLCCFIHVFFPFLFDDVAGKTVKRLSKLWE